MSNIVILNCILFILIMWKGFVKLSFITKLTCIIWVKGQSHNAVYAIFFIFLGHSSTPFIILLNTCTIVVFSLISSHTIGC